MKHDRLDAGVTGEVAPLNVYSYYILIYVAPRRLRPPAYCRLPLCHRGSTWFVVLQCIITASQGYSNCWTAACNNNTKL